MKKQFLLAALLAVTSYAFAQSDQALEDKYWRYKDRYLKRFTNVGRERGQSIPAIKYSKDYVVVIDKDTNTKEKTYYGKIEFGDASIDLGLNLAVLATEYKTRKDAGKDVTGTLNELYYALLAVNRIDAYAELYYGGVAADTNGFFIRTDTPEGFYKKWEQYGDPVHQQHSDCGSGRFAPDTTTVVYGGKRYLKDENGDYIKEEWNSEVIMEGFGQTYVTGHGYGRRVNEQSQDHTFGVMFGLTFVVKFVDNVFVKPINNGTPGDDKGFYLVTEAKAIAERITDYISERKTGDGQDDVGLEGFTPDGEDVEQVEGNYLIVNPVKGKSVYRGPLATQLGFAYPFRKAAERVTGLTKSGWEADGTIDIWYDGARFSPSLFYTYPPQTPVPGGYLFYGSTEYQFPVKSQSTMWWIEQNNIHSQPSFFNKNHIFKLAAISGLVDQDDYYDMLTADIEGHAHHEEFEILNAVLNDHDCIESKEFYQDFLDNGYCDGPKHFNDPPSYSRLLHFATEDAWSFNDYLDDDGHPKEGEFNGLDYMLLYNLYKIKFNPDVKTKAPVCACASSKEFYVNKDIAGTHLTDLSTLKTDIQFRFPEYKKINLEIPEWLTHSYNINSGGTLRPQGDLTICSSTTTINNGGKLSTDTNSSNRFYKIITIGKNAVLDLKSDGVLYIDNNTKVIVEESGKLIYNAGAKVYLNGPNAVLEIRGQLELKGGATFTPLYGAKGHGYVKFHKDWIKADSNNFNVVTSGSGNKFILNGDTTYTTRKLLEVTGNIGLNTDWELAEFKIINGHADMGKASCISANSANNQFKNFWMRRLGADYHGGIHLHGRTNKIHNARIEYANNGVTFLNIGTKESLNLDSLTFNHCKTSIRQWGGGINFNEGWIEVPGDTVLSARGCETLSKIFGVDAESASASTFGFNYFGSNVLRMNHNTVNGFSYGVNMIDAQLYLSCNQFNYNKYNSIKTNSSLYISQGYNTFNAYSANTSGLQSDIKINNSGTLWMKYGNNYFYGSKNLIKASLKKNQPKVYESFLPPSSPFHFAIEADSNNFESSPVGAPLSGYKYLLSCNGIGDGKLKNFKVSPSYNTNSYYASRKGAYCSEVIWTGSLHPKGVIPVMPGLFTDNYQFPVTDRDPLTSAHVQYYDTVFRTWMNFFLVNTKENVMDKTLISSTSYDVPIDSMKVILSAYNLPSYVNQSKIAYLSVYQMMHDAVAKAVYEKVVTVPTSGAITPIIRKALVAQQALYTTSLSSSYFWNDYRYMILKDWAQLYRLAERRDSAMVILNLASAVLTDPTELMGIDRWKCTNEAEIYYLGHPVPYDTLVKMYPCQYDDSTDLDSSGFEPPPSMQLANKQLELKKSILIYPNPTSNVLTIELKSADSKEVMLSVTITDLQGKTIATLQPNSGKTTFNTVSLPSGVYAVKVSTDKGSYSQTVNVIH